MLVDRRGFGPSGFHTRDPARLTRLSRCQEYSPTSSLRRAHSTIFPKSKISDVNPTSISQVGSFGGCSSKKPSGSPLNPGLPKIVPPAYCVAICFRALQVAARTRESARGFARSPHERVARALLAPRARAFGWQRRRPRLSLKVPRRCRRRAGSFGSSVLPGKRREKCCRWFPSWHPDF